jgi:hypothetical protein
VIDMKKLYLSLSLLFMLEVNNVMAQQGQIVPTDDFAGVIFLAEDYSSAEVLKNLSIAIDDQVGQTWTPQVEDIYTLESALATTLESMSRQEAPEILQYLPDYARQYIGVVVKAQQYIFATLDRCTDITSEQLQENFIPFLPNDGGTCFVEVLFDPKKKTFLRLYIHGEA